jgi:hypothetical protein
MTAKRKRNPAEVSDKPSTRSLFDHVKHIRQIQDPNYYVELTDGDKKTFNHFMILRAMAMDDALVGDMAQLYRIFDKIPSPQFYTLLINIVPKSTRFYPWIKSKVFKNNKMLLEYVAKRFKVSIHQANEYVNLLLRIENGHGELISICKAFGLEDSEIEKLFEEPKV